MAAYLVFTREKMRDKAEYDIYAPKARASMAGVTVKPLAVYGKHETLEGAPIDGSVIMEFPSMDAAKEWYNGPAYSEARINRFKGCDYRVFLVEGI